MLTVERLTTCYGAIEALHAISLHVEAGELIALIGANGAGKTTLLNSLSGIHPPHSGRIVFEGRDITHLPPEEKVRLGIVHVPEHRQLFHTMTVWENLILGAYHRYRHTPKSVLDADLARVFALFPRLEERLTQLAGTLSGGEQQMLAIGRALMSKPRLLLLDEPSLGLAPLLVKELFRVIADLRDEGITMILVEQNARAALEIADRAYVLETGQLVLEGTAAELRTDPRVQAAYLGGHIETNTE
ncbi:MAG: ABC transporter ATP-binding protein [Ardenticatenia bacterium]|nr:MAG: ABC transporter ATP-binding protein [Ardenticatenia bacterium]